MAKLSDIHDAFLFVSSGAYFDNVAVLCEDTGEILYRSNLGDIDEIEDKELDLDVCIEIPTRTISIWGKNSSLTSSRRTYPTVTIESGKFFEGGEPTEGSRIFWNVGDFCRDGMTSRRNARKRRSGTGAEKTR